MSFQLKSDSGYLGPMPTHTTPKVMIIEDRACKIYNIRVHEFTMGDVDDIEIYAAEPIWKWQQTDAGKWIMKHAIESPVWNKIADYNTFGHRIVITAKLKEKDYTFWQLKWGSYV